MTDEDQIRSLLTLAAELPDDIEAPVRPLLARGRRERKLRASLSVLSVVVIAAAAFALPPIVRALDPSQIMTAGPRVPAGLFPDHPNGPSPGPLGTQLASFRWSALPPRPGLAAHPRLDREGPAGTQRPTGRSHKERSRRLQPGDQRVAHDLDPQHHRPDRSFQRLDRPEIVRYRRPFPARRATPEGRCASGSL